jgi:hypothetical protein
MDDAEFWGLIADARAIGATDTEILAGIKALLATLGLTEIERFQQILRQFLDQSYRWDLWAVAYTARGGCGDDEFDFSFEGDLQCEELLSAAPNAYRSKAGPKGMHGARTSLRFVSLRWRRTLT